MNTTDNKGQQGREKAKEATGFCSDDCEKDVSQAPFSPSSLLDPANGRHGRMASERRAQLLWDTPPAAAEKAGPWAPLLWFDWGCQMPQAGLCLPSLRAMPEQQQAPPRKVLVTPPLPFCCLGPRGGGCFLQLLVSGLSWFPHFALSVFFYLFNWFFALNLLPEILRMVSICWWAPGPIWQWNWERLNMRLHLPALNGWIYFLSALFLWGSSRATLSPCLRLSIQLSFTRSPRQARCEGSAQTQPTFWLLRSGFRAKVSMLRIIAGF